MSVVAANDLSLVYPAHGGAPKFQAVYGVSFEVQAGKVLALLGESGSGKSSLLRFLSGGAQGFAQAGKRLKAQRLKILSGSATVLGIDLAKLRGSAAKTFAAQVGYISQQAGAELPGEQRVAEILMAKPRLLNKKLSGADLAPLVSEMLERVGLGTEVLAMFPTELSKGQRQRVAILAQLTSSPKLLIADEITNGVDLLARPLITELLQWYREKTGVAMVLVSHDIGLLENLVDNALVLRDGQTVGYDKLNNVFRDIKHPYVAELANALRKTAYDEAAAG